MKKIITLILTLALGLTALFSLVGCGKPNYKNLKIVELNAETEYFGIAFRKGSNVTKKVEDAISQLVSENKLAPLAQKYGIAGVSSYTSTAKENSSSTDWSTIQSKGKLVIGVTDYKPMDYKENGKWIGFDADLAKLVGEKLNIAVEFLEIEWDDKLLDLASGRIDCIWNGMTITNEITGAADVSAPYMENRQVAVILKSNAEKYTDLNSMAGVKLAAEAGSAGESFIKDNSIIASGLVPVTAQSDAFLEVLSGKSEVAIVDYMMAKALIEG